MANLDVNIKVHNLKSLDDLEKKIKGVEKSTKISTASLAKWSAAIGVATTAIYKVVSAGRDYQRELNNITGTTDSLTRAQNDLSDSFGQMANEVLKNTGILSAWEYVTKAAEGATLALASAVSGKTVEALVMEKYALKQANFEKEKAIELTKNHAKALEGLQERADKLWYDSEIADRQYEINEAVAEGELALQYYNDQLAITIEAEKERAKWATKFEMGRATWEATSGGEAVSNVADFAVKETKKNTEATKEVSKFYREGMVGEKKATEAIKENTKAVEKSNQHYQQNIYNGGGGGGGGYSDASTKRYTYGQGLHETAFSYSITGGVAYGTGAQYKENFVRGGTFKGTLQKQGDDLYGSTWGRGNNTAVLAREKAEKERLEAEQRALELAKLNADKAAILADIEEDARTRRIAAEQEARRKLIESIESDQNRMLDAIGNFVDALNDSIGALENISSLLGGDYYGAARSSLFGGTQYDLSYKQAKANAEAAWKLFKADTSDEDMLVAYNNRMDELIGTLDEFKDWTKYNSKAEQTFAKHKALRDVKELQDAQNYEKTSVDAQLEELKKIRDNTEQTYEEMYNVINGISDTNKYTSWTVSKLTETIRQLQGVKNNTEATVNEVNELETMRKQNAIDAQRLEDLKEINEAIAANTKATAEADPDKTAPSTTVPARPIYNPDGGGYVTMYKSGGYTGNMGINNIAGVVHGQEYVINAQTTKNLGINDNDGGVFNEMAQLLYEQLKTTKKIHNLEQQMYKLQKEEAVA